MLLPQSAQFSYFFTPYGRTIIVLREIILKKVVPSFHVCTRSYSKNVYFFHSYFPLLSLGEAKYLPTKSKKVKKPINCDAFFFSFRVQDPYISVVFEASNQILNRLM